MRTGLSQSAGRSRFGYSIIYKTCLHETGMKKAQAVLKSSRLQDRADYLQTGTNPERDEREHKYALDRPSCAVCFGTTHARQSAVKQQWQAGE